MRSVFYTNLFKIVTSEKSKEKESKVRKKHKMNIIK